RTMEQWDSGIGSWVASSRDWTCLSSQDRWTVRPVSFAQSLTIPVCVSLPKKLTRPNKIWREEIKPHVLHVLSL
ncbi:hypothetical protein BGX23_000575, partial [Mortierella sp. AD031]